MARKEDGRKARQEGHASGWGWGRGGGGGGGIPAAQPGAVPPSQAQGSGPRPRCTRGGGGGTGWQAPRFPPRRRRHAFHPARAPDSTFFSSTFSGFRSQWMMRESRSTTMESRICTEGAGGTRRQARHTHQQHSPAPAQRRTPSQLRQPRQAWRRARQGDARVGRSSGGPAQRLPPPHLADEDADE